MKRLLVLMLVLGLASMANAVTVTINDWMSATIYETDGTTEWDGSPSDYQIPTDAKAAGGGNE